MTSLFLNQKPMKIQKDLPQFNEKNALIIVSWEFQVKYYIAHNGQILPLETFAVANPRAKLQEDYLPTTKLGISGSIYNSAKHEVQEKLLRRLKKETAEIYKKHHIADVYLFCIDFMMERVKESLSGTIRDALRLEYLGDMQYHPPMNLLEIIQKQQDEKKKENDIILLEEILRHKK